jgi:hypothetical protein
MNSNNYKDNVHVLKLQTYILYHICYFLENVFANIIYEHQTSNAPLAACVPPRQRGDYLNPESNIILNILRQIQKAREKGCHVSSLTSRNFGLSINWSRNARHWGNL